MVSHLVSRNVKYVTIMTWKIVIVKDQSDAGLLMAALDAGSEFLSLSSRRFAARFFFYAAIGSTASGR
jgi:hypothetical protein